MIVFEPYYEFYLKKGDGSVWRLDGMQSCQALNVTEGGVGQCAVTFTDPDFSLYNAVQPHAMNVVQLRLRNRNGTIGTAWSGSVDEVHTISDPTQGNILQIKATSGQKLFEVTHMTPSDQQALAVLYATNVPASQVITAACAACGFPTSGLFLDPLADAASGFQSAAVQNAFLNPDEQTWSAVLSAIVANTGTELFFTPDGFLIWRRVGFLNVPAQPNAPLPDEIFSADLFESDAGVVTSIEVRWYGSGSTVYAPATWDAPAAMKTHLSVARVPTRHLSISADWITDPNAAQNLANILGMQYSATLLRGSVTLLADPLYAPGTVCAVPSLIDPRQQSLYYIASVSYALDFGQQWTMTLGLSYGRAASQSFPYIGQLAYPQRINDPNARSGGAPGDPANPARLGLAFTVQRTPSLAANVVVADPDLINPGSIVKLRDASGLPLAGPSANGEYTVQAGAAGSGAILQLAIAKAPTGGATVTVIQDGAALLPSTTSAPAGGTRTLVTPATATAGTGGTLTTPTAFVAQPATGPITQMFGATGFGAEPPITWHGVYYNHFHRGIDIGVPYGTPIVPAFSGVVSQASWDATGYGQLIKVTAGGWTALYAHTSQMNVAVGQQVIGGQTIIGLVGSTGNSTGAHLHFELDDQNGVPIDPYTLYLAASKGG